MKFLKKVVSVLLASVMCIPSGILSFANATEENTVTTVTLSDTENGFMQFSEDSMKSSTASQDGYHMVQINDDGEVEQIENDGSMWAFNAGDFVEIELIPDDGYNVKSFTIRDSAGGEVMASKETMDNIFSFTMPSNSVTVEAVFSSSLTVEVVPDDEIEGEDGDSGGLDVSSRYHDITESSQISEEEVKEVIFDLTTESYIKANLNSEYVNMDGTNEAVDVLHVKQTLFDGNYVKDDDTIDSIMHSIEFGGSDMDENIMKLLGQTQGAVYIYDYSKDSDYYVAYANTMYKDDFNIVRDWTVAYNNTGGMTVDGCVYDDETGLLYIPKGLYAEMEDIFYAEDSEGEAEEISKEGSVIGNLQVQFMQVCFSKDNGNQKSTDASVSDIQDLSSQVSTISVSENKESIDVNNGSSDIFANETTTFVDAGMDEENMEVFVNGAPVDESQYQYDPDSGELVIGQSSAMIITVEASEKEEGVKDQLLDMVAEKAKAISYDDMISVTKDAVDLPSLKKMPDASKKKCFEPFQIIGKIASGGESYRKKHPADNNPPYYVHGKTHKDHALLSDYARGADSDTSKLSKSKIVLAKEYGNLFHVSTLSSAKAGSGDSWINDYTYLQMIKKFGTHATPCAHIDYSGYGILAKKPSKNQGPSDSAPFSVRVVYIKEPKKTTSEKTENGYKVTTTKYTGGYVVFSVASVCLYTQTSCFLFKVPFEYEEQVTEESLDPLVFALVKDSPWDREGDGNSAPRVTSTLHLAKYRVDYYPDQKYTSTKSLLSDKESGSASPKCSWTFTTYENISRGSTNYQNFMDKMAEDEFVKDSGYTLAGIDFMPRVLQNKDGYLERSKWKNSFIKEEDLESWRENFGKKGTYHIYEVKAPDGFEIDGIMYDTSNLDNASYNPGKGMVVYMNGAIDAKSDKNKLSKILVNGEESTGEIVGEQSPGAALENMETPSEMSAYSWARFLGTDESGKEVSLGKKSEADIGPVKVNDTIQLCPYPDRDDVFYTMVVTLYDKTAEQYVNVTWDEAVTTTGLNPKTFIGEITEERQMTNADEFFIPSALAFTLRPDDLRDDAGELGGSIDFEVTGTISSDGMQGHELVFLMDMYCIEDNGESGGEGVDSSSGSIDQASFLGDAVGMFSSPFNDKEETLTFEKDTKPGLTTSLSDNTIQRKSGSGETMTCASKSQSLTDTIEYHDLPSGKTYTIKGKLVDAETGNVVKEVNEEKKTSGTNGKWDITFKFDASGLEGKKLVSVIEAYNGSTLAYKCDSLTDKNETTMIPEIKTELIDEDTSSHMSASGKSTLIDKISYKNLISGRYKVVSKLVNASTNAVVASATTYQNVTSESGNFEVNIAFDNSTADKTAVYVAYEELYIEKGKAGSSNWVSVAAHKDPNDAKQQMSTPGLKTVAMDQKTAYNISYAEKYVTIYDVVHYDNLIPNDNYMIVSTLVDKDTGAVVVDDNGVEQILEMTFETKENIEIGQYINNKPYKGDLYSDLDGDLSGIVKPDGTFTGNFTGNATYVKEGYSYGDVIPNNHVNGGIGFKLNAESFAGRTVVVYEELYYIGDGSRMDLVARETNLANEEQTIHFPKIWTNAIDVATNSNVSLGGDGTTIIKDTVSYENLIPGLTYRIKGRVIDRKKTLEAGKEVVATGSDGKEARSFTDFTPDQSNGTEELTFDIDTTKYAEELKYYKGAVFVVYEELYVIQRYDGDDAESLVATHTDINDENQTIYTPGITTELFDTKTGLHIMYAEKNASLTDTVSYYSFKPGQAYYVSGRLVDMRTGKTLVDSAGNEAKIDYQQETADGSGDGTWTLAYNLDASALAGTTVVAYAEVYVRGGSNPNQDGYTPVATHDDFFDRNERVYIPYIDTTLLDQKTDSHYALAEKDVVLYDTVHYTDIHPGDYEYMFESELRDQATGEIAVDNAGRELSLTTTFKADFDMRDDQFATYGDVIPQNYEGSGITFELDGEYFQDRTLVCYERMYVKGVDGEWKIVADHQELLDPDQTVHIGKGWTEAADGTTKTQTGLISKNATIVDTFYYQNLNPEYTYELKGKVVEKKSTIATGTDVVVAENTVSNLRPESSSGTWHNSFTFDATKYNSEEYYGATLVVYEELYQIKRYGASDDRLLIASEQDVNSASQTVWYPHIETELLETTSGTHVMAAGEDRELTDTVSYHNMQPDTSYVLKGWLVDMETGQVLTDSAGKRMENTVEVMSTDNGDGEWKINYSIDASALSGKLIVAYAEVYIRNGSDTSIFSKVAQHTDFWDSDERVYVPVISTVATDQKTNSHLSFAEDNMWITDRVYYSYLQADSEYRLISTLVDKETGEVVIDDKGIAQRKETTFNTTANASQEKYVQTITNPMTDSSDTGIGYAYGYVVPGDGTVLPDGKKPDGIVFSFDGGTFEGRTLVVYEELQMYNADGTWKTVATHMDLDDENQTIHIPKVRTNAIDSETMTHVSKKDGMVTIIDTVTYENLLPGMTYVIEGVLMDQLRDDEKAGMPIRDADGNMITGTVTFTPDKPNGTQRVVFQGNASDFHTDEGEFSSETLVVFEDLYLLNSKDASDDRLKVAEHRDIDDENQTIYFPRVRTKAVAYGLDGNPKQGDADHVNGYAVYRCNYCKKHFLTEEEAKNHINGTVLCKNKGAKAEAVTEYTLYDTLYYENLIPGRTYQVVGTIIDTATGKAVLKGHTAVQSDTKYFTPGSRSGEVDVVFHMDGPELAGGRYVVYEEIFLNGSSVASHMDINDKDQMFNVIDMKTSAKDQETGTNISAGNTVSTIIDTVEMGPLVENQEYYLKSALMDITKDAAGTKSENYGSYYRDASGEAVQGSAWRVKGTSVWHTMDEPVVGPSYDRTGGMLSVEVKFTVDTITEHGGKNFQGETYVLFEELRLAGGEVVAQHKDLADAQQTIQVGGMYTVAYDKDTGTNIMEATEGKTLYDTVYYSNLKPSTTYKVTTRIYVKEDSNMEAGEYVEVTPLNATNLVAAVHVTSRSGTGFWTISASMPDLSKYAGKTLVVYEDIVDLDGVQVAVENNLYNESQSIHLPAASTLEADNENGLHFTRAESKWFCDNDSCVTYTCNGCGEQFHSEDEAKKHLPDCWNRESDGYTCTGGCFDTKAEAEQHTAPVYECDNCGLHFSDKEDAEVHVNGVCKDAAVFRATQLVRDADGNVVNELWYACSGLNRLEFAGGRFRSFFCRKISLPHML